MGEHVGAGKAEVRHGRANGSAFEIVKVPTQERGALCVGLHWLEQGRGGRLTAAAPVPRRPLYPDLEPGLFGWLPTGTPHELYYEQVGSRSGRPAVVLHGGPGGAINPTMRRFFDPHRWRVTLFDQRGCGRSQPHASVMANTTGHLLSDIDAIRAELRLPPAVLFGGSWGATLALAYAEARPDAVSALVLRGVDLFVSRGECVCGSTKRSGQMMCGAMPQSRSRSISDSRTSRNSPYSR